MSDRNLPETSRAFQQWAARKDKQLVALNATTGKAGTSRVEELPVTYFPFLWHPTLQPGDSFWTYHTVLELDVDPGRWLLRGLLQFMLHYTGQPAELDRIKMTLSIFSRPLGTTDKTLQVSFAKCPLDKPINRFIEQDAYFRATLRGAKTLTSETGLTLSLEAMWEIDGASHDIESGSAFWLGPGVLIATPL